MERIRYNSNYLLGFIGQLKFLNDGKMQEKNRSGGEVYNDVPIWW